MALAMDCRTQSEWGRSFARWFVEVAVAVLEVAIVGGRVATADTKLLGLYGMVYLSMKTEQIEEVEEVEAVELFEVA